MTNQSTSKGSFPGRVKSKPKTGIHSFPAWSSVPKATVRSLRRMWWAGGSLTQRPQWFFRFWYQHSSIIQQLYDLVHF